MGDASKLLLARWKAQGHRPEGPWAASVLSTHMASLPQAHQRQRSCESLLRPPPARTVMAFGCLSPQAQKSVPTLRPGS
jgi:hypothetical protein